MQRIAELQEFLRAGRLPEDLTRKMKSISDNQRHQASHLSMLAIASHLHHSGGPRLCEPFAYLAHYTLAYLWEEHDDISDSWNSGLGLLASFLILRPQGDPWPRNPLGSLKMHYLLHILVYFDIYVIVALSLNLIVGYCGMLTMAHAGYYAIGGYTYAHFIFCVIYNWSRTDAQLGLLDKPHQRPLQPGGEKAKYRRSKDKSCGSYTSSLLNFFGAKCAFSKLLDHNHMGEALASGSIEPFPPWHSATIVRHLGKFKASL